MSPLQMSQQSTTVISDWQKRAKAQMQKYLILLVVAFVVATLVCVSIFFWFQTKNQKRIVEQNMNFVQDSATQEANQLEKNLNEGVTLINNLANQYVMLSTIQTGNTVEQNLAQLTDKNLFDRIGFLQPDGTDITLEGISNVYDRQYFKNAMQGGTGYEFLTASRVTRMPTIVFYAPIRIGGEIVGVMTGFYNSPRLNSLFTYQFFNYMPDTYLVAGDGQVIAKNNQDLDTENILKYLKDKTYTGETDYDEILKAIADVKRTSITFSFIDGKKTAIGVIAQFDKSEFMVVSIMPSEIVSGMVTKANNAGRTLLMVVSITFLLLVVLLIVFLFSENRRIDREMTLATDNLEKALMRDERSSNIIVSLGNTYSSVYYIDIATGEYERINERESSVVGLPSSGIWGGDYGSYVKNFVMDEYAANMLKMLDLDSFVEPSEDYCVAEYQRKDKGWRKAMMIPAETDSEGKATSLIFAVQKIDAEKKKELETKKALQDAYAAAQLANNAKTTFLSNMSHDIRTPMNAIIGMTSIAAANVNNGEKVADCLKKINAASKHLLGLINEVLDMSKIESGKIDLNEEQFSLSELIDELITINHPLIVEKNHALIVMIDKLVHENVIGDHIRLQQVFTNLLTNAIKYTPLGGKISITVSEEVTNKPNIGAFKVVFKDNGIGMTEEFQKTLFEPFTRANDDRITSIQGTGLGMPIARNIIRMMNGDIAVESKINEGSTFTVTFFLKLQPEKQVDYAKFANLHVLVVDDELVACESACGILDGLGIKSDYVTSGREAVKKAAERHKSGNDYFAVIIDWKMSDMNGIDTTQALRKELGDNLYIVVMSSYDWSDIEQEARRIGVNAFLSKPLFKSKLVNLFSDLTGDVQEGQIVTATTEMRQPDFTGKRILLAEDNELNREIACELLEMMGFETDTAENGKICYEMFTKSKKGEYDLILMDIQMPVMDGYAATKAIRSSAHPAAATIPIIAMTANAFSTDVQAAFDAGMNGHIAKPIDVNIVIKTLKNILD